LSREFEACKKFSASGLSPEKRKGRKRKPLRPLFHRTDLDSGELRLVNWSDCRRSMTRGIRIIDRFDPEFVPGDQASSSAAL